MTPTRSSRTSSRLAKRESKRLLTQTILFGLGAVLVIILFLFVILPGLIRLITGGADLNLGQPADTIPPQRPILTAPAEATNSAQIKLSGFTEPVAEVTLLVNGSKSDTAVADSEGQFEFMVSLSEGENDISVYASDEAGNESDESRRYQVVYDGSAPSIQLEGLIDGQDVVGKDKQQLSISGKTEPRAEVYINDRLTLANSEGGFSSSFQLQEGENVITLRAIDQAGNQSELSLAITFRP